MEDKQLQIILGEKIRRKREQLGLSREGVCSDESRLTARQLARIEAGETMMKIPTAFYLAERLEIDLFELLTSESKDYLKLKVEFIRLSTYDDSDRKAKKEEIIDTIFEKYYDNLPSDEQLTLTILSTEMEMLHSKDTTYGEELFKEVQSKIFNIQRITVNEILWMNFYLVYISGREDLYSKEKINDILAIIISIDNDDELFLELEIKLCVTLCGVMIWSNTLCNFSKLRPTFKRLILKRSDSKSIPVYHMMNGKYAMLVEGKRREALLHYDRALEEARFLEDDILYQRISEEMERDLH